MTLYRRDSFSKFLFFSFVWCVLSFKVILIEFGESGIRVDDFIIFFVFFIIFVKYKKDAANLSCPPLKSYFIFLLFSSVGALLSASFGYVDFLLSQVFVIRLLEYTIFFYIGYVLSVERFPIGGVILFYSILLIIVSPLQIVGIVPTASLFDTSRASGNTNGPYELAAVGSFLIFWLLKERKSVFYIIPLLGVVAMTGSRITFSALLVVLLFRLYLKNSFNTIFGAAIVLILVVFFSGLGVFQSDNDVDRDTWYGRIFSAAESQSTFSSFSDLYDSAPVYNDFKEYYDGVFYESTQFSQKLGGDDSANIRMIRWATLMKTTMDSPLRFLFGMGPSFGSSAVDGYFVRVFCESGFLGVLLFLYFLFSLLKFVWARDLDLFCYILVMLITAGFIDIFTSYKPMILLWFWFGVVVRQNQLRGNL